MGPLANFWAIVSVPDNIPIVFMLLLVNRGKLMGNAINGPIFNFIAWTTAAVMIGLTILLVAGGFGLTVGRP